MDTEGARRDRREHGETIRQVPVGDLTFDVTTGGPDGGTWVVLLHGFPVNGQCFDDVVSRLHDSGLRTIVFNQRGYSPGARPTEVDAYRLDALTADAIGVLDALEVHYALLVGHDWGSILAWHLAGKYAHRFTGLVAVSAGHPAAIAAALEAGDQRERSSYIKSFIAEGAEEKLLAHNSALLRRTGVMADEVAPLAEPGAMAAALNWYRANFTGDIAAMLACPSIEMPATMVWSDGDVALGREQAELSGRYVYSDYRFCELPGVDHWVPQHASAALASEIALRSAVF